MSLGALVDNHVLSTQEDLFLGLHIDCVPPLNFQVQMEHGKPFCEAERQRINFGPLIKETPFQKEKKLKEPIKENPPTLPIKEITISEVETAPLKRVVFSDELQGCTSLTSLNRAEQTRIATSIKELVSEKGANYKSFPKGILKTRIKSKYGRQFSNQSTSQNTKSTQISYSYSPKERKLSTFSRFHELYNNKYVESEDDNYSEDSIKTLNNNYMSEENLDPLVEMYRFSGWSQQKSSPSNPKHKY